MVSPLRRSEVFSFPESVNEIAARTVAALVVVLSGAYLLTGSGWLLAILAYGFVARVFTGPTLSPIGQLATRVIVPRLGVRERPVPGPPKRFAQSIGAVLSLSASALHVSGASGAALVVVALIIGAAFLEAAFGFCFGCVIFRRLMTAGVVPESVCAACNDLSSHLAPATIR
jgi:hypothetical protein